MQRETQFGAFRIVCRLGVGGMAETFIAERQGPAGFMQRVCLKRVLPAFCEDLAFLAMFQNEARLAARLTHPHIAQVYDFGEVNQQWWMTLELVDGIDLRALLDALRKLGEPLPLDLVLLIVADVCAALAYAHEPGRDGRPGIVHRDVSPSNVLLSCDGAVKLADFGIAKPTSGDRATASGIKGKVPYMSPEQALGGAVDGRSDLFSLGVMAFEMLADRRPFDGPTDLATLSNVVAGTRAKLAELAPSAPAQLVALVERLLAPDRAARPASASAVLDALSSTSPPLSSRRVLGQLVRRVRPPEAARTPVDPTGPTVPTPNAPCAAPTATASTTTEPTATIPDPRAPRSTPGPTETPAMKPTPAPTSTPVAFTGPSAQPTPQRPSRTLLLSLGTAALLLALAVGAATALRDRTTPTSSTAGRERSLAPIAASSRPAVERAALRAPSSATRVDAAASQAFATALDAGARSASEAPASLVARGTLTVTAYPWGLVEVDGRELGRSPIHLELPVGEHNVRVRADDIVKRRTITITAGARRELVVPLE